MVNIRGLTDSGQRKSQTGQAPVLAAIIFLLLVPTTIIVAENATQGPAQSLGNITVTTFPTLDNITLSEPGTGLDIHKGYSFSMSCIPFVGNDTGVNMTFQYNHSGQAGFVAIPTSGECNISSPNPDTDVENNVSYNHTVTMGMNDTCYVRCQISNGTDTLNSEERRIDVSYPPPAVESVPGDQAQESPEPEPPSPVLELRLDVPERADRSETFTISAEITNTGDADANGAEITWALPEDLSILDGSSNHLCDVPAGETCTSEIEASASPFSELGRHEIKAVVSYHD